jgi:hypothetical protein
LLPVVALLKWSFPASLENILGAFRASSNL